MLKNQILLVTFGKDTAEACGWEAKACVVRDYVAFWKGCHPTGKAILRRNAPITRW